MRKRLRLVGHSLALAVLALAATACMGDEQHLEVAYGVFREEVPTRIVVVNDKGKDSRRVTGARRGHSPVLPTWSPDGKRIAFVRFNPLGGPRSLQVWVVNADGTGERRVGEGTLPQWTRDGRFLVVERPGAPPQTPSTLHVLSVDGRGERKLTTGSSPALSHRGSRVAFVRLVYERTEDGTYEATSASLHTIGLDGTGLRRLIRAGTRIRQPSWLPGDAAVVAVRGGLGGELVRIPPNGGQPRRIVPDVGETYDVSPGGDLIAYTHQGILFIVRPDGTEVDHYGQSNAIDIEWSPDGKKVAFSVQEAGESQVSHVGLYVVDVDKGERRRFAFAEGQVAYLDWRPLPPED